MRLLFFSFFLLLLSCNASKKTIYNNNDIFISYQKHKKYINVIIKNISNTPVYINDESYITGEILSPQKGVYYSNILDGSSASFAFDVFELKPNREIEKQFKFSYKGKLHDQISIRFGYFKNISNCKANKKSENIYEIYTYCYYTNDSFTEIDRILLGRI